MPLPPQPVDEADIQRFIDEMQTQPEVAEAMAAQVQWQAGKDTTALHRKAGIWTASRAAVHQALLQAWVDTARKLPASTPPRAFLVLGLPGAGKNSKLLPKIRGLDPAVEWAVVDPDDVKETLPGYTPEAACLFHEESSFVARELLFRTAVRESFNIASMEIGSTTVNIAQKVDLLEAAGYQTTAWLADLPPHLSAYSVARRFMRTRRWVPLELVQQWRPLLGTTWAALKANQSLQEWQEWDMVPTLPVARY